MMPPHLSKVLRRGGLGLLIAGLTGASIAWGPRYYAWWFNRGAAVSPQQEAARYYTVQRGLLRVAILEDGRVRAVKNHAIFSQLRGRTHIEWLATEGAKVKKDDVIVRFERREYDENLQRASAELDTQKRQLVVTQEALRIQSPTTRAAVSMAETKLGDSEVALRTYENLEAPKKINELDTQISDAQEKLASATKRLDEAKGKIDEQISISDEERRGLDREVSDAAETVTTLTKRIDTLKQQKKIFRAYEYPQTLKTRRQAVENARLDVEKANVEAVGAMNQKDAEVLKVQGQIRNLQRTVDDLKDQLSKCEIRAPADGLVVYGDPNNQYVYYNNQVKVGAEWYSGNVLMTIPDLSAFEIDFAVPEIYRGRLSIGNTATMTLDAIPGLTLQGAITKIGELGRPRDPWNPGSPKAFDATIKPTGSDPRMISGMSVHVEVVTEVLNDVLSVPIEAVLNDGGKSVCFVIENGRPMRRDVTCGKSNDHFVQITAGLSEGERVDLNPSELLGNGSSGHPGGGAGVSGAAASGAADGGNGEPS